MSRKTKVGLPREYLDLIGTKATLSGYIFSYGKEIEPEEFDVLDVRRGTAKVINREKMVVTFLSFELKLKNESMKRAQWSKPIPDTITDTTGIKL